MLKATRRYRRDGLCRVIVNGAAVRLDEASESLTEDHETPNPRVTARAFFGLGCQAYYTEAYRWMVLDM